MSPQQDYFHHTLPNGIRIIHKQVKAEVAHCGIMINSGSRDEEDSEHGMAHFIEHVLFKGTKRRKAYHILSRLEDVGGELNAYTTKEETFIYGTFLKEFYSRAIELICDITFNSIFPAKELEKEKEVIIDEINSYLDSPSEQIFDDFEEMIYEGHALGRNILGEPEKLKGFKREDVLAFIQKNYTTDNMVFCSVGQASPNQILKWVEKYLGDIPEKSSNNQRSPFLSYQPQQKIVKRQTYQAHVVLGNQAYSRKDKNRLGLQVLNNLLGGPGMNSRLNLNIREKHGITYNLESHYSAYEDTGLFLVYLGTDQKYVNRTLRLVKAELKKLRDKKLGTLQLHKAKLQVMGYMAISFESNNNKLAAYGKSFMLFNEVKSMQQIQKEIDAITAEQLLHIANEIFDENALSMVQYNQQK